MEQKLLKDTRNKYSLQFHIKDNSNMQRFPFKWNEFYIYNGERKSLTYSNIYFLFVLSIQLFQSVCQRRRFL